MSLASGGINRLTCGKHLINCLYDIQTIRQLGFGFQKEIHKKEIQSEKRTLSSLCHQEFDSG
jgi:hypothetical protein